MLAQFKVVIQDYWLVVQRALETLELSVALRLPDYAQGEALDTIGMWMEVLKDAQAFQRLTVERLDLEQAERLSDQKVVVVVNERRIVQTFRLGADGARPIDQQVFDGRAAYSLIYHDNRWKVERIRPLESTGSK
jgi:hypothetical protein